MKGFILIKFILLILLICSCTYSQVIPYVSIGAGLSFNKHGTVWMPKISLGLHSELKRRHSGLFLGFANISFSRHLQINKIVKSGIENYNFIEFESGSTLLIKENTPITFGGGIGLANQRYLNLRSKGIKYSLFLGDILFARADYVNFKDKGDLLSLGFQGNLSSSLFLLTLPAVYSR
jgi:hypothetical protein